MSTVQFTTDVVQHSGMHHHIACPIKACSYSPDAWHTDAELRNHIHWAIEYVDTSAYVDERTAANVLHEVHGLVDAAMLGLSDPLYRAFASTCGDCLALAAKFHRETGHPEDSATLPVGAYVASALAAANYPGDSGEDVDRFLAELARLGFEVRQKEAIA